MLENVIEVNTSARAKLNRPNALACLKCGYEKAEVEGNPHSTITRQKSGDSIVIIGQDEVGLRVLPTVRVEYPKRECEGKRAQYWTTEIAS
jgi:DNA-directed RNA polymerase subunit M/transcription elongation factor TFIIS